METFFTRLKDAIGDRGYESVMRRAVQTVMLKEAHRCLADKLRTLRPFQRKLAFHDQCLALLESTDFILPRHKEEILWRTGTSKETMSADIAWKRMKSIDKELEKLAEKILPFSDGTKTHEETCSAFIQSQYELLSGKKSPYPTGWEYAHNNMILCYRMYYCNGVLDTNFPPPILVREIVVPAEKPEKDSPPFYLSMRNNNERPDPESDDALNQAVIAAVAAQPPPPTRVVALPTVQSPAELSTDARIAAEALLHPPQTVVATSSLPPPPPPPTPAQQQPPAAAAMHTPRQPQQQQNHHDATDSDIAAIIAASDVGESRRALLQEVREHLDLLKEFEGVISDEEMKKRKHALFMALPDTPPPRKLPKKDPIAGPLKLSQDSV
eukprot:CAMPEP_0119550724 /NCGR_PEP_ID=MMETSP1352-20130426/4187_1 /TAXON_ID=265584 /ORGANISM="Stauroneis constricta, Strain CCMP1120" /LENGTH=381 /DNA_ID=CAMNT_0007596669 /DNA_START=97 /DNA_END=1242 /DNA_ORIENTATION=-